MGLFNYYLFYDYYHFFLHAASPEHVVVLRQVISESTLEFSSSPALWSLSGCCGSCQHVPNPGKKKQGKEAGVVPASGNQRIAQTLLEVCFYHFDLNCAQGEIFSGLVVRKGKFELCSTNTQGRKGAKVEMNLSEPAYVTFHSKLLQNFSYPSSAKIYSRYQTIAGSLARKITPGDGYLGRELHAFSS